MGKGIEEKKILRYASRLLGGDKKLAGLLGVSTVRLDRWRKGDEYLPDNKLLKVLDLVLRATRDSAPGELP